MSELRVLGQCPACGGALMVTRQQCTDCQTAIEGKFALTRFDLLSNQQLRFLELFLRARGNIREVERAMGLSYPAVRARLDQVLKALKLEADDRHEDSHQLQVLDAVQRGELTVERAVEELRGRGVPPS